jgi:hypothetical protein
MKLAQPRKNTSKANAIVLPTPVAIVANEKRVLQKRLSRLLQLILLMI